MEPALHTGWLLIKTQGFMSRRWASWRVILRPSSLEWYTEKGGKTTRVGEVLLVGSSVTETRGGKYPFSFELSLQDGQVLPLRTDSAEALAQWLEAFAGTAAEVASSPSGAHARSTPPPPLQVELPEHTLAAESSSPARSPLPPALHVATEQALRLPSPTDSAHPAASSTPVLLAGWLGLHQHDADDTSEGGGAFVRHFFVLRSQHLSAYPVDPNAAASNASAAGVGAPPVDALAVAGMLLLGAEVDTPAQGFSPAACTFELYYPARDEVMVVQAATPSEVGAWMAAMRATDARLSSAALALADAFGPPGGAVFFPASPVRFAVSPAAVAGSLGHSEQQIGGEAAVPGAASPAPLVTNPSSTGTTYPGIAPLQLQRDATTPSSDVAIDRPRAPLSVATTLSPARERFPSISGTRGADGGGAASLEASAVLAGRSPSSPASSRQLLPPASPTQRFSGPAFMRLPGDAARGFGAFKWRPVFAFVTSDSLLLFQRSAGSGDGGSTGGASAARLKFNLARAVVDAAAPSADQPRNTVHMQISLSAHPVNLESAQAIGAVLPAASIAGGDAAEAIQIDLAFGMAGGAAGAAMSALLDGVDCATTSLLQAQLSADPPSAALLNEGLDRNKRVLLTMPPAAGASAVIAPAASAYPLPSLADDRVSPSIPQNSMAATPIGAAGPPGAFQQAAAAAIAAAAEPAPFISPARGSSPLPHSLHAAEPLVLSPQNTTSICSIDPVSSSAGNAPASPQFEEGPASQLPPALLTAPSMPQGRSPDALRLLGRASAALAQSGEDDSASVPGDLISASTLAASSSGPDATYVNVLAAAAAPADTLLSRAAHTLPYTPSNRTVSLSPTRNRSDSGAVSVISLRPRGNSNAAAPPLRVSSLSVSSREATLEPQMKHDAGPMDMSNGTAGRSSANAPQPSAPYNPSSPAAPASSTVASPAAAAAAGLGSAFSPGSLPLPPPPWAPRSTLAKFCSDEVAALTAALASLSEPQCAIVCEYLALSGAPGSALYRASSLNAAAADMVSISDEQRADLRAVQMAVLTAGAATTARSLSSAPKWGSSSTSISDRPLREVEESATIPVPLSRSISTRIQRVLSAWDALDRAQLPRTPAAAVMDVLAAAASPALVAAAAPPLPRSARPPYTPPVPGLSADAMLSPSTMRNIDLLAKLAEEQRLKLAHLQGLRRELELGSSGNGEKRGVLQLADVQMAIERVQSALTSINTTAKNLMLGQASPLLQGGGAAAAEPSRPSPSVPIATSNLNESANNGGGAVCSTNDGDIDRDGGTLPAREARPSLPHRRPPPRPSFFGPAAPAASAATSQPDTSALASALRARSAIHSPEYHVLMMALESPCAIAPTPQHHIQSLTADVLPAPDLSSPPPPRQHQQQQQQLERPEAPLAPGTTPASMSSPGGALSVVSEGGGNVSASLGPFAPAAQRGWSGGQLLPGDEGDGWSTGGFGPLQSAVNDSQGSNVEVPRAEQGLSVTAAVTQSVISARSGYDDWKSIGGPSVNTENDASSQPRRQGVPHDAAAVPPPFSPSASDTAADIQVLSDQSPPAALLPQQPRRRKIIVRSSSPAGRKPLASTGMRDTLLLVRPLESSIIPTSASFQHAPRKKTGATAAAEMSSYADRRRPGGASHAASKLEAGVPREHAVSAAEESKAVRRHIAPWDSSTSARNLLSPQPEPTSRVAGIPAHVRQALAANIVPTQRHARPYQKTHVAALRGMTTAAARLPARSRSPAPAIAPAAVPLSGATSPPPPAPASNTLSATSVCTVLDSSPGTGTAGLQQARHPGGTELPATQGATPAPAAAPVAMTVETRARRISHDERPTLLHQPEHFLAGASPRAGWLAPGTPQLRPRPPQAIPGTPPPHRDEAMLRIERDPGYERLMEALDALARVPVPPEGFQLQPAVGESAASAQTPSRAVVVSAPAPPVVSQSPAEGSSGSAALGTSGRATQDRAAASGAVAVAQQPRGRPTTRLPQQEAVEHEPARAAAQSPASDARSHSRTSSRFHRKAAVPRQRKHGSEDGSAAAKNRHSLLLMSPELQPAAVVAGASSQALGDGVLPATGRVTGGSLPYSGPEVDITPPNQALDQAASSRPQGSDPVPDEAAEEREAQGQHGRQEQQPQASHAPPATLDPTLLTWLVAIDLDAYASGIAEHFGRAAAGRNASSVAARTDGSPLSAIRVSLDDMATLSTDELRALPGLPETAVRSLEVAVRALRAVLSPPLAGPEPPRLQPEGGSSTSVGSGLSEGSAAASSAQAPLDPPKTSSPAGLQRQRPPQLPPTEVGPRTPSSSGQALVGSPPGSAGSRTAPRLRALRTPPVPSFRKQQGAGKRSRPSLSSPQQQQQQQQQQPFSDAELEPAALAADAAALASRIRSSLAQHRPAVSTAAPSTLTAAEYMHLHQYDQQQQHQLQQLRPGTGHMQQQHPPAAPAAAPLAVLPNPPLQPASIEISATVNTDTQLPSLHALQQPRVTVSLPPVANPAAAAPHAPSAHVAMPSVSPPESSVLPLDSGASELLHSLLASYQDAVNAPDSTALDEGANGTTGATASPDSATLLLRARQRVQLALARAQAQFPSLVPVPQPAATAAPSTPLGSDSASVTSPSLELQFVSPRDAPDSGSTPVVKATLTPGPTAQAVEEGLADFLMSLGLYDYVAAFEVAGVISLAHAAGLDKSELQGGRLRLPEADARLFAAAQPLAAQAAAGLRSPTVAPQELAELTDGAQ